MKKIEEMRFNFELRNGSLDLDAPPPRIQRLVDALAHLPDGTFKDDFKMAELSGTAYESIRHDAGHPSLSDYRARIRNRRMWGNKKTVAAWKAQNGKE